MIISLIALSISAMSQTPNSGGVRDKFQKKIFTDSTGTLLPYRMICPDESKPDDPFSSDPQKTSDDSTKYPVLLFLHGAGERGSDNEANLSYIDKVFGDRLQKAHPCYVIVPQCAEKYRWCETDWTLPYHTMPRTMSKYLAAANQLLDSVLVLPNADRNRVYVTGMSMGGFGTWDIICRYPAKFAAAMPICGGADEKEACKIKNIPIRTFHGATDKLVKVSRSRNIDNAIRRCGGSNCHYTEFPNMGHLIWDKVYSNFDNLEWLFQNHK